jgi:hypothetical protein
MRKKKGERSKDIFFEKITKKKNKKGKIGL